MGKVSTCSGGLLSAGIAVSYLFAIDLNYDLYKVAVADGFEIAFEPSLYDPKTFTCGATCFAYNDLLENFSAFAIIMYAVFFITVLAVMLTGCLCERKRVDSWVQIRALSFMPAGIALAVAAIAFGRDADARFLSELTGILQTALVAPALGILLTPLILANKNGKPDV